MKKDEKGKFISEHGMCFSPEYMSWTSMKNRCLRPDRKHIKYKNIPIHKEWVDSFLSFYNDMGKKPTKKHTIERINNNEGYYPWNCRWATRSEQNRNYSLNRILEYNGKKMCVTDWAEYFNIPRHRIFNRLYKGWSVEKALTFKLNL